MFHRLTSFFGSLFITSVRWDNRSRPKSSAGKHKAFRVGGTGEREAPGGIGEQGAGMEAGEGLSHSNMATVTKTEGQDGVMLCAGTQGHRHPFPAIWAIVVLFIAPHMVLS